MHHRSRLRYVQPSLSFKPDLIDCFLSAVANIYTVGECIKALVFSQRRHLQRAVAKLDLVKSEGYLQAVKNEVQFLLEMLRCLDAFTRQQTRLVVVVDGLDSCEQAKVLREVAAHEKAVLARACMDNLI